MHRDNPVIQLCVAGTQAEFQGQIAQAQALYQKAWAAARDAYEACIAAHYVARHQADPHDRLHWNQVALDQAQAVTDNRVEAFYPSLFLNMGQSHEALGNLAEAKRYYALAAARGAVHQVD